MQTGSVDIGHSCRTMSRKLDLELITRGAIRLICSSRPRSCGSLTAAPILPGLSEDGREQNPQCDPKNTVTTGNFCQSMPYTDCNGIPQGLTIFVATNCDTHVPLPFCYQQVPYLQLGVSSSPDPFIEYLYAHTADEADARDISGPPMSSAQGGCLRNDWPPNGNKFPGET